MIEFALVLLLVGLAIGRIILFVKRDTGSKEPVTMLWAAFGFGVLSVVITLLLEYLLLPSSLTADPSLPRPSIGVILYGSIMISVIEEAAKFTPLALFIYKKGYFNELTDGVIYFSIAGATFGLIEDILYTLSHGGATAFVRILLVPFFHMGTTGILGYYLARHKILKQPISRFVLAVILIVLIHAAYDFGILSRSPILLGLSLMLTALVAIGVFMYLYIAKQNDQQIGLAASVNNRYCSSCGRVNSDRYVFCIYCGRKT